MGRTNALGSRAFLGVVVAGLVVGALGAWWLQVERRASSSAVPASPSAAHDTPVVEALPAAGDPTLQPDPQAALSAGEEEPAHDAAAARELRRVADSLALKEVARLWEEGSPRSRARAIEMLGEISDSGLADELARELFSDAESPLNIVELKALSNPVPDLAAQLAAERFLASERGRRPRLGLIRELGSESAVPALLEAFEASGDWSATVRIPLAETLDELGESGPLAELELGVRRQLESPDPDDRVDGMNAAQLLGELGPCVAGLSDVSGPVRAQATQCVALLGGESELPLVEAMASDPDPDVSGGARIWKRLLSDRVGRE